MHNICKCVINIAIACSIYDICIVAKYIGMYQYTDVSYIVFKLFEVVLTGLLSLHVCFMSLFCFVKDQIAEELRQRTDQLLQGLTWYKKPR